MSKHELQSVARWAVDSFDVAAPKLVARRENAGNLGHVATAVEADLLLLQATEIRAQEGIGPGPVHDWALVAQSMVRHQEEQRYFRQN